MTENDIMVLNHNQIKELVDAGSIKFIQRYQDKYEAQLVKASPDQVL
jgi:hypothetical protein